MSSEKAQIMLFPHAQFNSFDFLRYKFIVYGNIIAE